ncbi:MAG TPA: lysine-sensitive aspartokinase 3 [Bryobacteraceae bacterium]|nr:lysine-sensitive aspartokinase 3 [Bryobacteraceae bacterium]
MIVMKFGGTSVESASAVARVAEIVRQRLDRRPLVVVSAMGKTTNRLLQMAESAGGGHSAALSMLEDLRDFHLRQAAELGLDDSLQSGPAGLQAQFDELKELVKALLVMRELTPRLTDAICSYGERLSSVFVTRAFQRLGIPASHCDARCFIKTDARHTQAAPLLPKTYSLLQQNLLPSIAAGLVPILGGFIGSTEDGITTTLGRGGSDFTAAIVGAGVGAAEIQIWTDVDGMLTADPALLPAARPLEACSFAEAAELAYFGAKVLHPATVLPAIEKNIPVRILNSRRPEVEGTRIVSHPPPSPNPIRSIACKRNITLVNIVSSRMLMAHGFLRRIFEVFDRFETAVDMLATSEVSVSLTVDNPRALASIRAEIELFAEVAVQPNQAIVCLVGENIRHRPEVAARAFASLNGVKTRMVSQGASLLNLSLVVADADLPRAIESLHREFFGPNAAASQPGS